MHRKKSAVEADDGQPELQLADVLAHHPARDLGPPVIECAEDREHHPAEQYVVEMCDHEVRVSLLKVDRHGCVHDSAQPAERELEYRGDAEVERGLHPQRTAPHGRAPTENLDPGGNRDQHRGDGKRRVRHRAHSGREHVMPPNAVRQKADEHHRIRHPGVTEQGLAREHRQNLRHHPEGRQRHDVDLRMAEQPEQVLPQDRRGTQLDQVEVRADEAVEKQEEQAHRQTWKGEQDEDGGDQHRPHEHRHPHKGHAAGAHIDDGDEEVEAAQQGRDAEDEQADIPQIDVYARRVRALGQVRVAEPSAVGQREIEPSEIHEHGAEQEDPEAQGVDPRKSDVTGADLQRDEVVREKSQLQRHDHHENHGRAVHREHLVVSVGREEGVVRYRELRADSHRLQAADQHEAQRGDQVQDRDALVIDGGQPTVNP